MSTQLSITQALPQLNRTRLIAYKHIKSGKLPATLTIIDGRAAMIAVALFCLKSGVML